MNGNLAARADVPRAQNSNLFVLWARMFSVLLLVIGAAIFAFVTFRPITVLPRITLAPGFALTNQDGVQVTSEDLRGKIVLYNFTYSRCTTNCPQMNAVMQQVLNRLADVETGEIPVRLVTITVDADYDKPVILAGYAQELGAETAVWQFLTGAANRLKWVIGGGFGVYYKEDDAQTYKLDPAFMLVDGTGILRAEYRTADPDIDIILRDIGLLAEEAQNSEGAARYAYEAAHLFLCYPR